MTTLNALAAAEHTAELRRAAERHNAASALSSPARVDAKAVSLRMGTAADREALALLAELDEQPALSGEALIALVDGEAVAALSLGDGRVVSNPFVATTNAVALLKLRADHLAGFGARRPRRRWRLRFA